MLLMTPGPTRVPDAVLRAGAEPMLHHRDPEFSRVLISTIEGLRPLFGTKGDILPIHATGRGAMEAAICNLFSRGDELLAFCNGRFGEMWSEIAERFGVTVHRICQNWNASADPHEIETVVESHPKTKAVLVAHSDTSTGVLNYIAKIAAVARSRGLLVLVDGVSSIGGTRFLFDQWDIDIAITATQKCLMSSPGMSFVAVSERAWLLSESSGLAKSYFDFPSIRKSLGKQQPQTPGTTPVHIMLQVNSALSLIHAEGLDKVFARHERMAQMVRDWTREKNLSLQCPELERYSPTLTAIKLDGNTDSDKLRGRLRERGILVARGIGDYETCSIRIGHMGDIRPEDVELTLTSLTEIMELG